MLSLLCMTLRVNCSRADVKLILFPLHKKYILDLLKCSSYVRSGWLVVSYD